MRHLLLLVAVACNTCPTPRLTDPMVADGLQEDADGAWLRVTWQPTGRLPDDWWEDITLSQVPSTLSAVRVTGPGQLDVRVADAEAFLAEGAVFVLSFGDPRNTMQCDHPGMDDSFITALQLVPRGDGAYIQATFTGMEIERGVL